MVTVDKINKACRIADNTFDIAEIQKILNEYKQGRGIDRQKVAALVERLNAKDGAIKLFNSELNPDWVLICEATDEQLISNLKVTLLYLSGKTTMEGIQELFDKRKSSSDA